MFLKVNSTTKHRKTAKEIAIYIHRVYFLLLKLESKKVYCILTVTLHTCLPWHADFVFLIYVQFISHWEATQIWWLWCRHKHQTKFQEYIYEEILAYQVCVYDTFVYDYS